MKRDLRRLRPRFEAKRALGQVLLLDLPLSCNRKKPIAVVPLDAPRSPVSSRRSSTN